MQGRFTARLAPTAPMPLPDETVRCWGVRVPGAGGMGRALLAALLFAAALPAAAPAAPVGVTLVAGNGQEGHAGDGGPATQAQLAAPARVAVAPGGSILIADEGTSGDGRIRQVSAGGQISSLLAPGPGSPVGNVFAPIAVTPFQSGYAVADDELGAVYLGTERIAGGTVDDHDPEGSGSGTGGACDADLSVVDLDFHGMATVIDFARPTFLLVDEFTNQDPSPDGWPGRVLRLAPGGNISAGCSFHAFTRVAGGGPGPPPGAGFAPSGDGQQAVNVYMNEPTSVASLIGAGGGFLVATSGRTGPHDCRVRRVSPQGFVTTVAGVGLCLAGGEGEQAAQTPIDFPSAIAPTPDGGFLIVEGEPMTRIRRVAPDGTISTIEAHNPYGGLDTSFGHVPFPTARGIAVLPDGDVLVASIGTELGEGGRVVRLDTNFAAPPPGPPQPQPPAPLPPPAPPQPPPADPPRSQSLSIALAKAAYRARRGRKLVLRFRAGGAGSYELTALRRGKRRLRASGRVGVGANRIAVKVKLKPGRYTLRLKLTAGALTARDTAKLTVRR